ncbi:MAG: radical SAM protein [Actinobacteria bacterium]|nr:radical SAM protein [Actinomycetota bacterium]
MSIFYGPVLSRRFGYSLGIDIIPYKICSYDCIYCQLGKTTKMTVDRKSYIAIDHDDFKNSLNSTIDKSQRIDYVTFSGSGEPTLNKDIGDLISDAKEITDIPVVVLTNGSLLDRQDVIDDIKKADLIKVSLDAPDQASLEKINYPHPDINFSSIIRGLNLLLDSFNGSIWLEIMLVKGINDSIESAHNFEAILNELEDRKSSAVIEKIHLNTPVRPPGKQDIQPPDYDRLLEIKNIIGEKAEMIKGIDIDINNDKQAGSIADSIIDLVKRRPVTSKDISKSLRVNINEVLKYIKVLIEQGKIKSRLHNGERFYYF